MLKVSPWKGVVRFGKAIKLSPRYIGPLKFFRKDWPSGLSIGITVELSAVHDTFHVSNLKKIVTGEDVVISTEDIHIDDKIVFVDQPVEVSDRKVKS